MTCKECGLKTSPNTRLQCGRGLNSKYQAQPGSGLCEATRYKAEHPEQKYYGDADVHVCFTE